MRSSVVSTLLALGLVSLIWGCGTDDSAGAEPGEKSGPCLEGNLCNQGLECVGGVCVEPQGDVEEDACTPDCSGRECGDDGCGGSCGDCSDGVACSPSGQCGCTPDCTGKVCGDDGCGGECGDCFLGEYCLDGKCECEPACGGKECGDDGCGGSCGDCNGGVCKEDGMCCAPFCVDRECGADGCGGSCGDCTGGLSCFDGKCDCRPASDPGAELDDPAGNGLVWVKIKAGCFKMGCNGVPPTCLADEKPEHMKTVAAFQILKTEVTRTQYLAVMGTDSGVPANCMECPITGLTYDQAKAFCEAISARLPAEAEWEYAARGGQNMVYGCGLEVSCLDSVAWHADNAQSQIQPVAQKSANGYGLHDMLGNAWERVEDCYHTSFDLAPQEAFPPWLEECDMNYRVARGGWAGDVPADLHVTRRLSVSNTLASGSFGFRCVR